jgi:catechol 2,3-dioxygenase-like lactoylglutathione lyase family enzyme
MEYFKGLAHVAIKVDNLDTAVRFYCEGLGMVLQHKAPDAALVAAPDGVLLELFAGGQRADNKSGFTHFCLDTYDADATFARALQYGATASRGEPYTYSNLRIAFVTAPTGEEVEFWYVQQGDVLREPIVDGKYVKSAVHAALTVPDMDAVIRFYEGLGVKMKVNWEWGCSMTMGDKHELELFTKGEYSENSNGIVHVCFYTDDVDATLARAVELGGTITDQPKDWSNIRFAFFKGLAGERVELFYIYPDKERSIF